MQKVVGLPNIILTVTDIRRCKKFYKELLIDYLGGEIKTDEKDFFYFSLNKAGFSIGISQAATQFQAEKFNRHRVGLHHFALELENNQAIDDIFKILEKIGAVILDEPKFYPEYSKNYYAVYFEDPSGLKMEFVSFKK